MKRCIRNLLSIALVLCMFVGLLPQQASAASVLTAKVSVSFGQSEARKATSYVNRYRSSNLSYDYQLESLAMQRAAEQIILFDHTRPDGSSCDTIFNGTTHSKGSVFEGIQPGYSSASDAIDSLLRSTKDHKENLLSNKYRYLGVGHVVHDGVDFWVVLLSNKPSKKAATTAVNGTKTVTMRISKTLVPHSLQIEYTNLKLTKGQSTALPSAELLCKTSLGNASLPVEVSWTSSKSAVAKLSGGKVSAVAAGSARLTAKLSDGTSAASTVTVQTKAVSLNDASVTLSAKTAVYTGKNITPAVTVKLSGKTLTKDKDYTLTYQNNLKVGTAKVIVTGKGNYSGKVETTFTIQLATPVLKSVKKSGSAIQVTWGKTSGAVKYRVYVKVGSGAWNSVGDTTDTSLSVKRLDSKTAFQKGVRYTFTVRCISADGKQYTSSYDSTGKSITY